MRLTDALTAMRRGKAKKSERKTALTSIWGEHIDPEHTLWDYPRPQLRRREWICLNGLWQYAITRDRNRPSHMDGDILVPFSPESRASGVNRSLRPGEYLWYQCVVTLAVIPEGKRLILHFGAVDQSCVVWWNGHPAAENEGGYLAFSSDVTAFLREGENVIRLRVRDDTEESRASRGKQSRQAGGMFYTAQSGIWQTVWLEWVPENYLKQLKITPHYDQQTVLLDMTMEQPTDIDIQINWEGDSYIHRVRARDFPKDGSSCRREIPLPAFRPWSPEHPFLYKVVITAGEDRVLTYFAMRKFSVGMDDKRRPRLFLNNEPYFFNGVLDQGYWPEGLYTAPSDKAMIADIRNMKAMGFNTIRKHVKIEPLRWYYHCDRMGMIVWQDMVNGGSGIFRLFNTYLPTVFPFMTDHVKDRHYRLLGRSSRANRSQWVKECERTIDQLYNCPCIAMWVLFNEGWGQFDALKLEKRVRALDETRLIDHASGWFDQDGGDVKSVHNYFRRLKLKNDRRPFVISEYGGASCLIAGHSAGGTSYGYRSYATPEELTVALKKLQREIRGLKGKGLSGAIFTQLSDIEEETNGLYTYDRKVCKVTQEKSQ